jgi:hypothetical protein
MGRSEWDVGEGVRVNFLTVDVAKHALINLCHPALRRYVFQVRMQCAIRRGRRHVNRQNGCPGDFRICFQRRTGVCEELLIDLSPVWIDDIASADSRIPADQST